MKLISLSLCLIIPSLPLSSIALHPLGLPLRLVGRRGVGVEWVKMPTSMGVSCALEKGCTLAEVFGPVPVEGEPEDLSEDLGRTDGEDEKLLNWKR